MASNLQLKSNVYLRKSDGPLRDDTNFIRRVRGLPAIRKLLGMFGLTTAEMQYDSDSVRSLLRQGKITNLQHNALKWELRCMNCDSIPVGLTFEGKLDSRCDRPGCSIRTIQAKYIRLPDTVFQEHKNNLRAEERLSQAIKACKGKPPELTLVPGPRTPILVRIDATTAWLYSEEELSSFMLYALTKL